MKVRLHHTHIFASDMNRTLTFWKEMFGAKIILDKEIAGARNVMISIGSGKLNIYDQAPPKGRGGAYHHLGIQTDDLDSLIEHMKSKGFEFPNKIKDFGTGRYMMAMAPDNILLEIFESFTDGEPDDVKEAFDMD